MECADDSCAEEALEGQLFCKEHREARASPVEASELIPFHRGYGGLMSIDEWIDQTLTAKGYIQAQEHREDFIIATGVRGRKFNKWMRKAGLRFNKQTGQWLLPGSQLQKGWWREEDSPEAKAAEVGDQRTAAMVSDEYFRTTDAEGNPRSRKERREAADRLLMKIQSTPGWEPVDYPLVRLVGRVLKIIATIVVILVVMEIML